MQRNDFKAEMFHHQTIDREIKRERGFKEKKLSGDLRSKIGYKARQPQLDPECRTTVRLSPIVI